MYRLSLIILLVALFAEANAQSPHGGNLKVDCKACHTSDGWSFVDTLSFNHDSTEFLLDGQHTKTDCKSCHTTLVFEETSDDCMSCHTDLHSNSVGNDCARCHNTNTWLVDFIPELHEINGFPLVGAHATVNCISCHKSENDLVWNRMGNECSACHLPDYESTHAPNHIESGFSTNCAECHDIFSNDWGSDNFHLFFPLTGGHDVADCNACHEGTNYQNTSPECISCHQADYDRATNPNHSSSGFSTECTICHTTNGWEPASMKNHDAEYFPIYSGEHRGEWNSCTDCHTQQGNYAIFSCIDCHEHNRPDMDDEHDDERDYRYESNACFNCHPKGEADD